MILIGQFDSPFVRRVGIALRLLAFPFEHRPWSVFDDAAHVAAFNPLGRVPTLVLDDGEVLIETMAILDHLDEIAGPRALLPGGGAPRRAALRICALAGGVAEKAVSLVYERALHETISPAWVSRCEAQIGRALAALDAVCPADEFIGGVGPGHADIAIACGLRFLSDAHPGLLELASYQNLPAALARAEALPVFREISQVFQPPVRDI